MKKGITNKKILITNISRIIMSFLFINISFGWFSKILGINVQDAQNSITCYAAGPQATNNVLTFKNILIIFVPVAIVIGCIILIIRKIKNNKR